MCPYNSDTPYNIDTISIYCNTCLHTPYTYIHMHITTRIVALVYINRYCREIWLCDTYANIHNLSAWCVQHTYTLIHVCAYVHTHVYICVSVCVCMCVYVCSYTHIEKDLHHLGESHQKTKKTKRLMRVTCIHTYKQTNLHICVFVSVFVSLFMCMCVCESVKNTQKMACIILEEVIKKWATSFAHDMHACMHAYIHTYKFTHMCVCVCIFFCICVCVCVCECIHTRARMRIILEEFIKKWDYFFCAWNVYIHTYAFIHMCVCVCICVYVCVCVCVYTHRTRRASSWRKSSKNGLLLTHVPSS